MIKLFERSLVRPRTAVVRPPLRCVRTGDGATADTTGVGSSSTVLHRRVAVGRQAQPLHGELEEEPGGVSVPPLHDRVVAELL